MYLENLQVPQSHLLAFPIYPLSAFAGKEGIPGSLDFECTWVLNIECAVRSRIMAFSMATYWLLETEVLGHQGLDSPDVNHCIHFPRA